MLRVAGLSCLACCLLVTSAVSVDVSDEVYSDYVEERVQDSLLQQQRTVNNSAQPRSNSVLQKRRGDCPDGFKSMSSTGSCYAVVTENLQWSIASLRCRSLHKDAHLVVINNAEEQAAVAKLIDSTSAAELTECEMYTWGRFFWTAGQRIDPSSRSPFIWRLTPTHSCVDSVYEMRYTKWFLGQPDYGDGKESCVHLASRIYYAWNDQSCTAPICSVCEIEMQ